MTLALLERGPVLHRMQTTAPRKRLFGALSRCARCVYPALNWNRFLKGSDVFASLALVSNKCVEQSSQCKLIGFVVLPFYVRFSKCWQFFFFLPKPTRLTSHLAGFSHLVNTRKTRSFFFLLSSNPPPKSVPSELLFMIFL